MCSYTSSDLSSDFDRIICRATAPIAAPTLLFTIFLGANDACFIGDQEYVPWRTFKSNIRRFIETILTQDTLSQAKIVLITPPPIAIALPESTEILSEKEIEVENKNMKKGQGYRTYMTKKRYADGIMQIASEYEETGRVVGLNFWQSLVDAILVEEGPPHNKEMPPGCGLLGAIEFGKGWFTDGLHLDRLSYDVLSQALFKLVTEKWPELEPTNL
jgi:lysophospholipase L1-like esterase